MDDFQIPKQLLADCHHLGGLSSSELLLSRNAALPWFILVPRTGLFDVLDLPEKERNAVMGECAAVSAFIKKTLGYDKVNVAGLGNVVAAMHLHVIGRQPGDACWPQPVWGNLPNGGAYTQQTLEEWQAGLVERIGLRAIPVVA